MLRRLKVFLGNISGNIFVFSIIFFMALGFIFYLVLGSGAREALIEQMLHREQVIARSGAGAIGGFFELAGKSLAILAKNQDIVSQDENSQKTLEEFVSHWKSTSIVEAIIVDKDGEILFVGNKAQTGFVAGVSVADRDYFIASKKAEASGVFMGKPLLPRLGAFEGQLLIPVSTPIFDKGEFKGVLVADILLSKLINDYLNPLKISSDTEVYIVSSDGELLQTPFKKAVGKNIFQQVLENPFLGSEVLMGEVKKRLERGGEGKIDIVYPKNLTDTTLKRRLIAYSSIEVCKQRFFLAVATPVEDALAFIGPIYTGQIAMFTIIFLAVVAYAVRIAKIAGFREGSSLHAKLHKETNKEERNI